MSASRLVRCAYLLLLESWDCVLHDSWHNAAAVRAGGDAGVVTAI